MDNWNIKNILRITGGDPQGKVYRLLNFTDAPGEVADPWYTGDFDIAFEQVEKACKAFLKCCRQNPDFKA